MNLGLFLLGVFMMATGCYFSFHVKHDDSVGKKIADVLGWIGAFLIVHSIMPFIIHE